MRVSVVHVTRFTYSQPVSCAPMLVRLRPRAEPMQDVLNFQLEVAPSPMGRSDFLDFEGNGVSRIWFDRPTSELVLTSQFRVLTRRTNPFDFLLPPAAIRLPLPTPTGEEAMFRPYLNGMPANGPVADYAQSVLQEKDGQTVPFLSRLAGRIQNEHEPIVRPEGDPWPAERTLAERRGSCRDLAVLFCDLCRSVGLPARFVSGYQVDEPVSGDRQLHAWSEVYLPGAGWRGFDPMQGLAVADRHVVIAASRIPADAAPTSGHFHGAGMSSTLEATIELVVD